MKGVIIKVLKVILYYFKRYPFLVITLLTLYMGCVTLKLGLSDKYAYDQRTYFLVITCMIWGVSIWTSSFENKEVKR